MRDQHVIISNTQLWKFGSLDDMFKTLNMTEFFSCSFLTETG